MMITPVLKAHVYRKVYGGFQTKQPYIDLYSISILEDCKVQYEAEAEHPTIMKSLKVQTLGASSPALRQVSRIFHAHAHH